MTNTAHGVDQIAHRAAAPSTNDCGQAGALRAICSSVLRFTFVLAILWVGFEFIYLKCPYIRPGVTLIIAAKDNALSSEVIYPPQARRRVAVFGMSTVLAGFKPDLFDSICGPGVWSYNCGMAGDPHWMPRLEEMIAHGNVPTDIMLTIAWMRSPPKHNLLNFAASLNDKQIMKALFPFRSLPRDAAIFFMRARGHGGVRAYYAFGKHNVDEMLAARGYFYIESERLFPSGRLPDDFHLESDTPDKPYTEILDPGSPEFARLCQILHQHHIHAYFIPGGIRRGSYSSAAPMSPERRETIGRCRGLQQIGPEYWIMPPSDFADPVHLNPEGAAKYTRQLGELMRPLLDGQPAQGETAQSAP